MKRLSAIIATMALTLMLSSVAYADYLGISYNGDESEYTLTYSMFQQLTDGSGNSLVDTYGLDLTSMTSALAALKGYVDGGGDAYLWGYFAVSQVASDSGVTWQQNTDPGSVTGLFWGLEITNVTLNPDYTAVMTFSSGSAALFSGTTYMDFLDSIDVSSYMINGELQYEDLLNDNYAGWADTGLFDELLTLLDWTPGIVDGDTETTQVANFDDYTSATVANGQYYASVNEDYEDSNFGDLIDSNVYDDGQADLYGATNIEVDESNLGWDFRSKSGDATLTAVPEPSTFLLIGLGMIGCFAYARRRRNNA